MIEDSLEAFVQRWRGFAAEARLFARPEGSPLLELALDGAVLQTFERTNPYLGAPGTALVLVQPVTEAVRPGVAGERALEVPERAGLRAHGLILERDDPFLAVDAGTPLVVACEAPLPGGLLAGDWVSFDARPPVHAFVLPRVRTASSARPTDEAL